MRFLCRISGLMCLFLLIMIMPALAGTASDLRATLARGEFDKLETALEKNFAAYKAGQLGEVRLHDLFMAFGQQPAEAIRQYNDWVKAYPASGFARLSRGYYLYNTALRLRAEKLYGEMQQKNMQAAANMMQNAGVDFQEALKLLKDCTPCEWGLLEAAKNQGNRQVADRLIKEALQHNPQAVMPVVSYANALDTEWLGIAGEREKYLAEYAKGHAQSPVWAVLGAVGLREKARAAHQQRNLAEALRLYDEGLKLRITYELLQGKAGVLMGMRKPQEALAVLAQALEKNPLGLVALERSAAAYLALNQPEKAIEVYRLATEYGSDEAFQQLARLYLGSMAGFTQFADPAKAREHCNRGALRGLPNAAYCIGTNYFFGSNGYEKNLEQAYLWFDRAAKAGVAPAMTDIGFMLWNGRGVTANQALACKYWQAAGLHGEQRAQQAISARQQCQARR